MKWQENDSNADSRGRRDVFFNTHSILFITCFYLVAKKNSYCRFSIILTSTKYYMDFQEIV